MFLYLWVNLAVVALPLAFSRHPGIRFDREWGSFFRSCALVLVPFIVWDIWFTAEGVWGFNLEYLTGISLAGLPLEEWMFFVFIPYACVFTYAVVREKLPVGSGRVARAFCALLLAVAVGLLLPGAGNAYSTMVLIPCALFLGWLLWSAPAWAPSLLQSFLVLLPAFVLTNGVLTGLDFWKAPVVGPARLPVGNEIVWYNNAENLAVRIFTIPVEDFFYAILLIGLNVALFENFRKRRSRGTGPADAPG